MAGSSPRIFSRLSFESVCVIRNRTGRPPRLATSGHREEAMTQNTKLKQMPTKSGEWLEAECLKLARRTLGGSEIQYVTIRRLHPKGTGPNWKVADWPLPASYNPSWPSARRSY